MPEGPEVRVVADCLCEILTGKLLLDIRYDEKSKYFKSNLAKKDEMKFPLVIKNVFTKGKKIIITLANRNDIVEFYLVSSLGMEGRWTHEKGPHSNLWLQTATKKGILRIIEPILYFDDSRHFGSLEIINSEQISDRLDEIGPDLLFTDVSLEEWLAVTQRKRISHMEICKFLMEQKYFSGIGNYLRAEILYHAKIRPNRTLGDLTVEELDTIRKCSLEIIRKSYASKGCTLRTYWDVYGRKGEFQVIIYGKKEDPYGNPVITETFSDGRTTHWIPSLQN